MLFEGRVQRTDLNATADGIVGPPRLGAQFEMAVADSHARYYDAVRRGNVFFVTSSGTQALSLNTASTATGIILWNPPNSGKNIVLLESIVVGASLPTGALATLLTGGAQTSAPTGTATTTVANGIQNALFGGGNASKMVVYSGGTMATATIQRLLNLGQAATMASGLAYSAFKDEIAGALVIPPGVVTSLQAITTAITVLGQLTWEEVPI